MENRSVLARRQRQVVETTDKWVAAPRALTRRTVPCRPRAPTRRCHWSLQPGPGFPALHHSITPRLLSFRYPEYLEDAFEFGIAEKGNFDCALSLSVAQMDFRAEALTQLIFQVCQVSVAAHRRRSWLRGRARLAGLQPRDQPLCLANIKPFLENSFRGDLLLLFAD